MWRTWLLDSSLTWRSSIQISLRAGEKSSVYFKLLWHEVVPEQCLLPSGEIDGWKSFESEIGEAEPALVGSSKIGSC